MKNEMKVGALLSYILVIITAISGLLYTPILLNGLGKSEYGLYMLIGSLVGYISIMDFGLHNTIYRYIAKFRAKSEYNKQENFLALIFIFYGLITLLILLIGIFIYIYIESIFKNSMTNSEIILAKKLYIVLMINIAFTLPLGAFQNIAKGYGKFIFINSINIVRIIVRTILLIMISLNGFGSLHIALIDTIFNLLVSLIFMIYCFVILKIRIKLYQFSINQLKAIISYSYYVFILAIVNQFFWKLGQISIGILSNTSDVAEYSLSINLIMYFQQIGLAISSIFIPKVTEIIINSKNRNEINKYMIKIGRIQNMILGLFIAGFIVLGKNFIQMWAGDGYELVYLICIVNFIPLSIVMSQTIGSTILKVESKQKFKAYLYLIMAATNFGLSLLLYKYYGIVGIGISTAISVILFEIILLNIYYHKEIGINVVQYFKQTYSGLLLTTIITIIIGYFVNRFEMLGWFGLIVKAFIIGIIYLIFLMLYGLNKHEKKEYLRYLFKIE